MGSRYTGQYRMVAIAVVVDDTETGSRMIMGSRDVHQFSIEQRVDHAESTLWGDAYPRFIPVASEYEFNAIAKSMTVMYAQELPQHIALPKPGLFLPGIGFKALPAPKDDNV